MAANFMAWNGHDIKPGRRAANATAPPNTPCRPPTRHYPLDIPNLRFFRYEHHLDTRDIMAHRIMVDLMNPKRVLATIYATPVKHPAEFNAISTQDKRLGADLRCLQKMLFTTYVDKPSEKMDRVLLGTSPHPTLEDQVVDLVRRHYFKRDDAALRAWIAHVAPGRATTGSRSTAGLHNCGFKMMLTSPAAKAAIYTL
jgi:hypothetical protein